MMLCVGIQEPTDHALVLGAVPFSLTLEEFDAALGQGECDLYALFVQGQILWLG